MKSQITKLLTISLLFILIFSGCSTNKAENVDSKTKTLTIATSFYPIYVFTLNIAKGIPNIKVIDMTKPVTGCLHDYSITTDDMKKLEKAQILVINGAGMESFMDKLISQQQNLKIVDSSKLIQLIKGKGNEGYNSHIWVSISNAIQQVKNIGSQLSVLDPKNAVEYKENTDTYVKKLETERAIMHKTLDGLKNRDIITFHEAFPYFAKEFNLHIAGVIEREPNSEPNAKELAATISTIKKLKVKALFAEPQYSGKAAETIATETKSKVYMLDPAVTGPMNADAYINIMKNNLKILQEALR